MTKWQTIDTAPKDGRLILVYGLPTDLIINGNVLLHHGKPGVHAAAWDEIDGAFCLDGGSWLGPFIEPTKWQPAPSPPQDAWGKRRKTMGEA